MKSKTIQRLKQFIDEGFDPLDEEMQSDLEYTAVQEEPYEYRTGSGTDEPGHIKNPKLQMCCTLSSPCCYVQP